MTVAWRTDMDLVTPRQVGKSSLTVSPLGMGGGPLWDPQITSEESLRTVAAAWESGARLYDTAPWYGIGRSERRIGMGLASVAEPGAAPPRDEYRVNTKVGRKLVAEPVANPSNDTYSPGGEERSPRCPLSGFRVTFDYSYESFLGQHQDSLNRLGLATVDSLTIHDICPGYHSKEQIEQHLEELSKDGGGGGRALEELRASGAISAIGCGVNMETRNLASWADSTAEDACQRVADLVDIDFFLIAGPYHLLETCAMRRLFPLCEERNIGVIIGSTYAGGLLVTPDAPGASYMYAPPDPEVLERAQRMNAICKRHGVPLAAAAIQFPLAHPRVAAVIPGGKTPDEVSQNGKHIRTPVPGDVWKSLKEEGLLDPEAPTPATSMRKTC